MDLEQDVMDLELYLNNSSGIQWQDARDEQGAGGRGQGGGFVGEGGGPESGQGNSKRKRG